MFYSPHLFAHHLLIIHSFSISPSFITIIHLFIHYQSFIPFIIWSSIYYSAHILIILLCLFTIARSRTLHCNALLRPCCVLFRSFARLLRHHLAAFSCHRAPLSKSPHVPCSSFARIFWLWINSLHLPLHRLVLRWDFVHSTMIYPSCWNIKSLSYS